MYYTSNREDESAEMHQFSNWKDSILLALQFYQKQSH